MSPLLVWPLAVILVLFAYKRLTSKKPNLPPSPPGLPFIGNLLQLGPLPHRSLLSLSKKHGPLILIRLGQVPVLVASSAAAARDILRTHDASFAGRPFSRSLHILTSAGRDVSFSPHGDYWRRARRASVLHLLSPSRVRSFRSVRDDEVALLVRRIAEGSAGSVVNVSEALYAYSNGVTSRAVAGKGTAGERRAERFKEMLGDATVLIGGLQIDDLFPSLAWVGKVNGMDAKLERMARRWSEFLGGIVEEHRSGGGGGEEDFVDSLLSLRQGGSEGDNLVFDDSDIKAIVVDLIAAGTDSSHAILEWAMSELIRNPRIMRKLQDEVRGISEGKPMVTEEDVERMEYLKATLKEVLRLRTPAPLLMQHQSTESTTLLQGYEIPAGTRVIINAWAIGRDGDSWESPEDFRPERFITGSVIDYGGSDFKFIPFGAGRRACPGVQFGMATVELALANLVHHFDWELPDGMMAEELNMDEAPGLTTPRKVPLHLVAKYHTL